MSKVKRAGQTGDEPTHAKARKFAFTIQDDIQLLKCCIQQNPFQLGKDKWNGVLTDLKAINSRPGLTVRAIRDRLQLLKTKYQAEQLTSRTGTEELHTERAELLEEVIRLIVESESTINLVLDSENEPLELGVVFDESELAEVNVKPIPPTTSIGPKSKIGKKAFEMERKSADLEREELLSEEPPSPNATRTKRRRLSAEDELIKVKVTEDFKIENRKLDLEEKKLAEQSQIEKDKLALEMKKEERLADENKRRDELTALQLKIQSDMFSLMQAVLKSKE